MKWKRGIGLRGVKSMEKARGVRPGVCKLKTNFDS